VINDHIGFVDVVVIGDASGRGARAYESRGRRFARSGSPDEVLAGDVQLAGHRKRAGRPGWREPAPPSWPCYLLVRLGWLL
jgi:hypothetical protein